MLRIETLIDQHCSILAGYIEDIQKNWLSLNKQMRYLDTCKLRSVLT